MLLDLTDQGFDLLGDGVVFVIDRLLFQSLQVQYSISLLSQHVLRELKLLKLILVLIVLFFSSTLQRGVGSLVLADLVE